MVVNPKTPSRLGVCKCRIVSPDTFTAEEWRVHEESDRRLAQQNQLLRDQGRDLWEKVHELEDRTRPPPSWARANVPEIPEGVRKKRGARDGHQAHHPPAPIRIDSYQDVNLERCSKCGEGLGEPFAIEGRLAEESVPGHVCVTNCRVGRYR
jgi:hypothetical protein